MTLTEFADEIGANISVRRFCNRDNVYFACFERYEVEINGVMVYRHGSGDTPEGAMQDYARIISGHTLKSWIPSKDSVKVPVLEGV